MSDNILININLVLLAGYLGVRLFIEVAMLYYSYQQSKQITAALKKIEPKDTNDIFTKNWN